MDEEITVKCIKSLEEIFSQKPTKGLVTELLIRLRAAICCVKKEDFEKMNYQNIMFVACYAEIACRMKKSETQRLEILKEFSVLEQILKEGSTSNMTDTDTLRKLLSDDSTEEVIMEMLVTYHAVKRGMEGTNISIVPQSREMCLACYAEVLHRTGATRTQISEAVRKHPLF